jgi:thioredoxin reductase/ferredoxin
MTVEIIVGFGVFGLLVMGAWTVVSVIRGARKQAEARVQHEENVERGVLPVSLHPRIDLGLCIGSGSCVRACPENDVLSVIDGKAVVLNPTACIGHGECLRACPVDAIQLVLGHERRGVDIPLVAGDFQTAVPGLFVVGELGGMGLVYNAMTQALQCVRGIVADRPSAIGGVHDLVIVGAGPAGLAASLAALEARLDFVTVDQEKLGGAVLQYPRHKVVMTRPVNLPLYGRLYVTEVRKEDLLAKWLDIVDKTGLQVREHTKVEGVTRGDDGVFDIQTSTGPLRAQRVLLAMGRRGSPRKLGVPGEESAKVCYRLVDAEHYTGSRCLVVGGGDAAVEAAVALGEAGATTHLSYRRDVFARIKPKNQKRLDEAVAAGTVTLMLGTTVSEIRDDSVIVADSPLPNDYVLVFAGGILPTKFLEACGVEVKTFKGEAFAPANR